MSWSRVKVAQLFAEKNLLDSKANVNLFMGDMMDLPLLSNSIDLVYTVHALEPNGGKERELLKELYRVTKRWLVLLEPSYEFANHEQKKRMVYHGYIKGLKEAADESMLAYPIINGVACLTSENAVVATKMEKLC